MKRHYWLILIVISILGMFFLPKMAYSVPLLISQRGSFVIEPVTLPYRHHPFPSPIPGPQIQLPTPATTDYFPGGIRVVPFVEAPAGKGFFSRTQKAFAGAPNDAGSTTPTQEQLNAGFDKGAKPAAPAVEESSGKGKKQTRVKDSIRIQVPTHELEREIGV